MPRSLTVCVWVCVFVCMLGFKSLCFAQLHIMRYFALECRGFESHSRQLNFSKKKWAVLSVVELFALHLHCCSSMIHVCVCVCVRGGEEKKRKGVLGIEMAFVHGHMHWRLNACARPIPNIPPAPTQHAATPPMSEHVVL